MADSTKPIAQASRGGYRQSGLGRGLRRVQNSAYRKALMATRVKRCMSLAALGLTFASCEKGTPVAPSLAAACSANPGSGTAPLPVSFGLNVSGAQGAISVRINYGDGSSGTD